MTSQQNAQKRDLTRMGRSAARPARAPGVTRRVNRNSARRWARRWGVESDVGDLYFEKQATGCRGRTNPVCKRGSFETGGSG